MVMENETLRRCSYELHDAYEFCVDAGFEIISFIIDSFGSWNVSIYISTISF